MSALTQITKRAKQLRNANKNLAWSAAIKKASAEYRAKNKGKKPVARKIKKATKKKRKVGSTLLLERGENPRKKPTRIVKIARTKAGTFKKFSAMSGAKVLSNAALTEFINAGKSIDIHRRHIENAKANLKNHAKTWSRESKAATRRLIKMHQSGIRADHKRITEIKKNL